MKRSISALAAELLAAAADRDARRVVLPRPVDVAEEERLVLRDRPAEAAAELLILELADLRPGRALTHPVLVAAEAVRGALRLFAPLFVIALMPPPENPPDARRTARRPAAAPE